MRKTDIVIVGSGVAGLYCALNLPQDKEIVIVTKDGADQNDSYLAQGGICVLKDPDDYNAYFEDTMRAGHFENNAHSVDIMIRSSVDVIPDLIRYGVEFEKENGKYVYTKEGAHSSPRILFHEDETGKEITSKLLAAVKKLDNVTILEYYTMVDILSQNEQCVGVVCQTAGGDYETITADYTVLATGGIGGLYSHSTNYAHLTGDALAIAIKHGIKLLDIDCIQIHPTTLYTDKQGRAFLISESVRGEGAVLLDKNGERFVDELLPRDVVANAIHDKMKEDGTQHVWLSMAPIPKKEILTHFKHIYEHCLSEGYDVTKEPIPVVPAQHYFMGGIAVDAEGRTSMKRLYAAGETACNGVHGRNRLASNSLLESLVWARRAAKDIERIYTKTVAEAPTVDTSVYQNYKEEYKKIVLRAIEKEKNNHE